MDEDGDFSSSPVVSDYASRQPSPSAPGSNKRRRLNTGTTQRNNVDDSWILDPPRTAATATQSQVTPLSQPSSAASSAHFQVGQIVRVYMKNFVTYTEAVVYPGPTLNMVIGPNGTGKSTLVCAICLGLGFRPDVLGRAKDVGEFVKNGHREAVIEIELKGEGASHNTIIRRVIKREGNKSTFSVNGESANNKKALDAARSFNIQVDNLCHFLPQDRVVEFSRLSPVDLLEQTLKAIAPAGVIEDFQQLKTLRAEQRGHEGRDARQQSLLDSLRSKQEAQRVEVETMRERDALRVRMRKLIQCRPIVEMRERKAQAVEARRALKDAEAQTKLLQDRLAPSLVEENNKGDYLNKVKATLTARQSKVKSGNIALAKVFDKELEKVDKKISGLRSKKAAHVKSLKECQHEILKHENMVKKIDIEIDNGAPDIDLATLNERRRDFDRQIEGLKREIRDLNEAREERNPLLRDRKQRIKATDEFLDSMNTTAGRSGQKLQQHNKDAALAWNYVKERREKFRGPVYGPAVLECTADKAWSGVLETLIREGDLTAITVTSREDFQILQDMVYGELGKRMVTLRSTNQKRSDFRKPLTDQEEVALQVKRYAIDLLDGPDAVLAMLCENARLHSTPVYDATLSAEVYDRIQECESVSNVMTPSERYEIRRRREYGVSSLNTNAVRPGKFWNEDAVDGTAVSEARRNRSELQSEVEELERLNEEDKGRKQQKEQALQQLEDDKLPVEEERSRQQEADIRWKGLPSRRETCNASLKAAEDKFKRLEREINVDIYGEESKLVFERTMKVYDMGNAIHKLQCDMVLEVESQLAKIEAESDYEQIKEENRDINEEYDRMKDAQDQARQQALATREAYQRAVDRLNDDPNVNELGEFYESLDAEHRQSMQHLEMEISSVEARIEMIAGGSEGAIAQFEERAKRIDKAIEDLDNFQAESAQVSERINEVRGRFEPFADKMVDEISTAFANEFAKINCTGAVELAKSAGDKDSDEAREDGANFDRWSIDILVSFRKDAPMQKLDSQRQSGGERAVSTIFYLMALQSTSRAPFRIVDEINQGMDPRNERVVHGRLVKIACGEGSGAEDDEVGTSRGSQYFLITPKLLPGLDYIKGMKVHCIASGEHMPRDPKLLDLRALATRARQNQLGRLRPVTASA